jgi:hypothetical protein
MLPIAIYLSALRRVLLIREMSRLSLRLCLTSWAIGQLLWAGLGNYTASEWSAFPAYRARTPCT